MVVNKVFITIIFLFMIIQKQQKTLEEQ